MNKLNRKFQKAKAAGWNIYPYKGRFYLFHVEWHWLAAHEEFPTKRAAINQAFAWSYPSKHHELIIEVS